MAAAMNRPTLALSLSTWASVEVQTHVTKTSRVKTFHTNPALKEVKFKKKLYMYLCDTSLLPVLRLTQEGYEKTYMCALHSSEWFPLY